MRKACYVFVGLVILGGMFAAVGMLNAGDVPETIVLKAKNGDVTLSHRKHTEGYEIKCGECHHTWKEGEKVKKCDECHGVDENAPKPMKAFHDQCKGCHETANEKDGKKAPTGCKECHIKK